MITDTIEVKDFDTASDRLAQVLPTYERRDNQTALAHGIEEHLRGGSLNRHAIYQAGCGVGKSFGYLIPAILSGKRVIVSTGTKALQDQIANKDLPFLAENLGVDFTYSILKGRANYLCQAQLAKLAEEDPTTAAAVQAKIEELNDDDFLAQADDFDVEPKTWRSLTKSSTECPGKRECPFGETCFSEKAKAKAKGANLVIVNHALLLTDLWVSMISRGNANMLGDYDAVIIDEAHELEEYATTVFGKDLREGSLINLGADVQSFSGRYGKDIAVRDYTGSVQSLWAKLEVGRLRVDQILNIGEEIVILNEELVKLSDQLQSFKIEKASDDKTAKKGEASRKMLVKRIDNLITATADLVTASFDDLVRWVDIEKFGKTEMKVLHSVPIDVSKILRAELFQDARVCLGCDGTGSNDTSDGACTICGGSTTRPDVTAILVSATLKVQNSFSYVAGRLGIDYYDSFDVGTPFDYTTQCRLYVPEHIVEPTPQNRNTWEGQSITEIRNLITTSRGGALVLFTSVKDMRAAYDHLNSRIPYTCFIQGEGTNKELAARFMEDESSVLFATKSFFTGVDFQGDACKLVIISKLPFPVPTDPIIEARCESIERKGGNSFKDYTIPVMTLILQQGFGRLIRHSNDKGVVAILDRRLTTKPYGKKIVRSLPESPLIETLTEVEAFYNQEA